MAATKPTKSIKSKSMSTSKLSLKQKPTPTPSSSSYGAPAQYNQPSRKGKRAWRKNVDIVDVEEGMEEMRGEERVIGWVGFFFASLSSFCFFVSL